MSNNNNQKCCNSNSSNVGKHTKILEKCDGHSCSKLICSQCIKELTLTYDTSEGLETYCQRCAKEFEERDNKINKDDSDYENE